MPVNNFGADEALFRRLNDYERRLKVLEVTPQVPNLHVQYAPYATGSLFQAVTSASFVSPFAAYIEEVETDTLLLRVPWSSDAATTGQFRVRNVASGSTTSTISITAGASVTTQVFTWLHGSPIGATGVQLVFEFLRSTGAGSVYSGMPASVAMVDSGTGTATGL